MLRLRAESRPAAGALSIVLAGLLTLVGCGDGAPRPNRLSVSGPTMGTTYAVTYYADMQEADAAALQSQIDALLERVNAQMSTWRPDSELSRFNASREPGWFPVSADVVRVVEAAAAVSALSGGAFDVTVGPMVNLWGFGPDGESPVPPPARAIEATKERVGYGKLSVRTSPPALRKRHPELYVDLSAIAKGFAVDEVARLLDERGIDSYLVEIGGELRARGAKPDGSQWKVAIERPVHGDRVIENTVDLRDMAIATSGDYRNYVERDGKRYSHTIDARSGRPIDHGLASVSVIAGSAMHADALATAIMALGPTDGGRLALDEELAVQMIVRSAGEFRVQLTKPFLSYLSRPPAPEPIETAPATE